MRDRRRDDPFIGMLANLGKMRDRPLNYKLAEDGRTPVPCPDTPQGIAEWGLWYRSQNRVVAQEIVDGTEVSTIFLGMDYGCFGPPLVFETRIMNGDREGEQWRYSTWDEAEAGHREVCGELAAHKN